jgi:hypothetical protein
LNIDMHCHTLTEEMIRLLQGVSKTHAPYLRTTDQPYPSGLTTSSQGFTLTVPGQRETTWPEGGHNVEIRLEDMARTGVDCQAVSCWPAMYSYYGAPKEIGIEFAKVQNEQFAELKKKYPGKFAPLRRCRSRMARPRPMSWSGRSRCSACTGWGPAPALATDRWTHHISSRVTPS